jgi:hypothetical protein
MGFFYFREVQNCLPRLHDAIVIMSSVILSRLWKRKIKAFRIVTTEGFYRLKEV